MKDPALPDTLYVTELVAPDTVNTMPEKTLEATFDHGVITGDTVTGAYADAHAVFDELAARRRRHRRRHPGARGRGRREVHRLLARTAGDRRQPRSKAAASSELRHPPSPAHVKAVVDADAPRPGRRPRRVAASPRATRRCGVPRPRPRHPQRLGWVAGGHGLAPARARDRGAARRARREGRHARRARGHGRLVARPRGHRADRRACRS